MQPTTIVVTVTTATTRVQVSSTAVLCAAVFIEPARANTGRILVGDSTVAVAGTGLFSDLAIPGVGIMDRFQIQDQSNHNTIDLSKFYLDATVSGDKAKVTYWVN